MTLPKLNTSGNDQTATLNAISQRHAQAAATKGQQRRNALMDVQLSPEMQALTKARKKSENTLLEGKILEQNANNAKAVGAQIRDSLVEAARLAGDGTGQGYVDWYHGMAEKPKFKDHMHMLPDPQSYMQTDLASLTGQSITKEKKKELQAILGNRMTAADRTANGYTTTLKAAWLPDGTAIQVYVPSQGRAGEAIDAESLGIPGLSFDDPTKVKTKEKLVKVMVNGKPVWKTPAEAAGKEAYVKSDSADKANELRKLALVERTRHNKAVEAGKGAGKSAKAKWVFNNPAGETLVVMDNGKTMVQQPDGKMLPATEAQMKNAKRLDVAPDELTKVLTGMLNPEGEVEESVVKASKENPTEAEVKAMEPGTKFIVDGKTYVRK